jgi:hypothetical protein
MKLANDIIMIPDFESATFLHLTPEVNHGKW